MEVEDGGHRSGRRVAGEVPRQPVPGGDRPCARRSGLAGPRTRHRPALRVPGRRRHRRLPRAQRARRSEEHTSELQSLTNLVCRLLLEKKKKQERLRAPCKKKKKSQKNA